MGAQIHTVINLEFKICLLAMPESTQHSWCSLMTHSCGESRREGDHSLNSPPLVCAMQFILQMVVRVLTGQMTGINDVREYEETETQESVKAERHDSGNQHSGEG